MITDMTHPHKPDDTFSEASLTPEDAMPALTLEDHDVYKRVRESRRESVMRYNTSLNEDYNQYVNTFNKRALAQWI